MVFATTLCGRVFLTDEARRRHSEIHPSLRLYYIRSRGEEFTSDSFLFSFNFILSQSIGPFRLPTAPALSVVSLEVDMSQQGRSQPFRIMTLVGYYTKLQRRDGDFVPPSTGTD
jgi:hypothetical protein